MISKTSVLELEEGLTYIEIIKKLGKTKDVGSGRYVARYIVDEELDLTISFGNYDAVCELSGKELIELAKPINAVTKE